MSAAVETTTPMETTANGAPAETTPMETTPGEAPTEATAHWSACKTAAEP